MKKSKKTLFLILISAGLLLGGGLSTYLFAYAGGDCQGYWSGMGNPICRNQLTKPSCVASYKHRCVIAIPGSNCNICCYRDDYKYSDGSAS